MRFEVLLQSAALKNLRQKLSQVSFSAGMYFLLSSDSLDTLISNEARAWSTIHNSNHLFATFSITSNKCSLTMGNREFQRAKTPLTFDNRETGFFNHNYNNIFKFDWLSTALIAAFNRTV